MVRVIRQSIRCFLFGTLGAVPIVGCGLALQALRLHRRVLTDLQQPWKCPPLYFYWIAALINFWAYGELFGGVGAASVFLIFAAMQTYHLWRSFPRRGRWNPGERHLFWGVALAYLGWYGTITAMATLIYSVATTAW
jgi:hypothetical protein